MSDQPQALETVPNRNNPRALMPMGSMMLEPKQIIAQAIEIATDLTAVIEDQKLYSDIRGKKYIRVEGWQALGGMLGVTCREISSERYEDGTWEARVDVVRNSDGVIIGGASAICGNGEPTWMSRPEYARKSMAATRATSKALRLCFAWIVQIAGYETTPAEEVDNVVEGHYYEAPDTATQSPVEPPRTKMSLAAKAKERWSMTPIEVKEALDAAQLEFDVAKWDQMLKAIDAYAEGRGLVRQESN
jgi:hypothetical protein